ncbi:DUF3560 domain-containing protein [Streptomyces sp. NPDC056708]|uniref:DUF3560 domain-containing protein n=1 Tax=unclassified Streptomyces TaxID=2593676 RepID=UPI0036A6DB08
MADVTITHTRADGTLLEGSRKGDGVFEIVRDHGFWFSSGLECLYIRRSQDEDAQQWRINGAAEALRAAGHTVTVEIDEGKRRTFAEAEADRVERAEGRAERRADLAARTGAASDAARERSRHIGQALQGEPIKIGHHSEGRHRRDLDRMYQLDHKSWDLDKKAKYHAGRASAAEHYEEHRFNPQVTLRRLERLGADLRQQERYHEEAVERGWEKPVGRHGRKIQDLREEIAFWEDVIEKAKANGVKLWSQDDFAPGDYVMYGNSWYQVVRANPKTLSIAWNLRQAPKAVMSIEDATVPGFSLGTHSADYSQVQGRCPDEAMRAFLADGKVPGLKLARPASEAAPADAIRQAQAEAKKKTPKRRSDPKVPKRVKVECRWDATEATLTWLNGNNQPHKDHEPMTVTAPEGTKFTEAVWSRALLLAVSEILDERGYAFKGSRWAGSPGRGIVRAIEPAAEVQAAEPKRPEPEDAPPVETALEDAPPVEAPPEASPEEQQPDELHVEAGGQVALFDDGMNRQLSLL